MEERSRTLARLGVSEGISHQLDRVLQALVPRIDPLATERADHDLVVHRAAIVPLPEGWSIDPSASPRRREGVVVSAGEYD
jgi:hypothetical protein